MLRGHFDLPVYFPADIIVELVDKRKITRCLFVGNNNYDVLLWMSRNFMEVTALCADNHQVNFDNVVESSFNEAKWSEFLVFPGSLPLIWIDCMGKNTASAFLNPDLLVRFVRDLHSEHILFPILIANTSLLEGYEEEILEIIRPLNGLFSSRGVVHVSF